MKERYEKWAFFAIIILGVLWIVIHMTLGIDMEDSGYYLAKYRYIFEPEIQVQTGSMLLTEMIGGWIYHMLPSHQYLVFVVLGCGSYFLTAFLVYRFFRRKKYDLILLCALLVGVFFSCSWIRMLNYNALSMLFQTIALLLLMQGLKRKHKKYAFVAGVMIGLNVLIRLPNILQFCFGAVFLWHYGICKGEWKKGFQNLGWFVLGGIAGGLFSAIAGELLLKKASLLDIFSGAFQTLGNAESRHGFFNILNNILVGLERGISMWAVKLFLLAGFLFVAAYIRKRVGRDSKLWWILWVLIFAVGFLWGTKIDNMYVMGAMIGVMFLASGIKAMFSEGISAHESSIACLLVLSELILTVGTDNGWYYQLVFMAWPVAAVVSLSPHLIPQKETYAKVLCGFAAATIVGSSLYYSANYVYRDAGYHELSYRVDVPECAGMRTTAEKGQGLESLYAQLNELDGEYRYLAALGSNCLCYCFSDLDPCFTSVWPDLESLTYEDFVSQFMDRVEQGEYPVIVFSDFELNWELEETEKYTFLYEMTKQYHYTQVGDNPYFEIYIRQ